MTQTNEWGTPAPVTEWGAPDEDANVWGDDGAVEETPQPRWGDDPEGTQQLHWGDAAEESPTQGWQAGPADEPSPWGEAAEGPERGSTPSPVWGNEWTSESQEHPARSGFTWSEDEQDDSPLGRFETEAPQRERKIPTKALLIGGGALVTVLLAAVVIFGALSGTGSEAPADTVAEEDSVAVAPELQQFEPFSQQLEEALNNRDAEAYYALFSEESQENITEEDTEGAIGALAPGAQYEVELVNGSAAGPTATVKLTLVRTLAGDVTERELTTQLHKEGEDWKMVTSTDDQ